MTLATNINTGIAGADVQRTIVAIANLIDDIKPQSSSLVPREMLSQRVKDRLAMRPLCRIVTHREAFLNADPKIAHSNNDIFLANPRIRIALCGQITPILTVI